MTAQSAEPFAQQSGARLVTDGAEAFALRVLGARAAERSLDVQYYIWRDDSTGRYLANELLVAADRGVRVRILLDDMDARPRGSVLAALDQHEQIEIRLFNPFRSRSGLLRTAVELFRRGSRLNHRMHNKAWIADERIATVGGRNIGNEYFSAGDSLNFVDTDVALTGAAVDAATREFVRYWDNPVSVPITRMRGTARNRIEFEVLRAQLRTSVEAVAHSEYAQQLRASPTLDELIAASVPVPAQDVEVIADDPRKALDAGAIAPGVLESLIDAIGATRRELLLISPYFVPGAGGTGALRELVRRGVRVAVLTNSLAATDVAAVHSGYSRYRTALLECGVALHELKPTFVERGRRRRLSLGSSRASLHTKAVVADRERLFVGSFNLDPRSAQLNCEMGVWIRHAALAEQLATAFTEAAAIDNSYLLTLDGRNRPLWTERNEGRVVQVARDPEASWRRRALTAVLGLLPLEAQL